MLRAILAAWSARVRPDTLVTRDVAVFSPRPPDLASLRSVCTWREGHTAPIFAIEVVSQSEPRKEYAIAPDKYAASGAGELVGVMETVRSRGTTPAMVRRIRHAEASASG